MIPKSTPGKWRLILDLSAPEGRSVNDGISESWCLLSYITITDGAQGVASFGKGALVAKIDVKNAYRVVPIHPDDTWLFGMLWEDELFVDIALPFGLRSAPKIFSALADAVVWIAKQNGIPFLIHYLDDFLIVGPPSSPQCAEYVTKLIAIFEQLGLPIALDKLEGPAVRLTFLGFKLDSARWEVRLPQTKLTEIQHIVRNWIGRKSCTRRELESLVGKLAHASRVIRPGKTFMRRLYELLAGTRRAHHHICLNAAFRSDLQWWALFMESWNGVTIMSGTADSVDVWTDTSGSFGCGAVCPSLRQWIQLAWPPGHPARKGSQDKSILWKELVPIVLAGAIWGNR